MTARRLATRGVAGLWIGSGLGRLRRWRRRRRGDFRVFVLEYHAVEAGPGRMREGAVPAGIFRRQVRWLRRRFPLVTVAEAAERLRGGLERDLVALTFDDGYADNAEVAFPILRDEGVPATIYLATAFLDGEELWFDVARRALGSLAVGRGTPPADAILHVLLGAPPWRLESSMRRLKDAPAARRLAAVDALRPLAGDQPAARPMTWDQARALQAAGIELGAHTVHHPILSRLDAESQAAEIAGSLRRLDEELGPRPRTFAMPNGSARDYDRSTLEILRRLPFVAACTTRRGSNGAGADLLELRRLGVGDEPLYLLQARLDGLFDEEVRRRLAPMRPRWRPGRGEGHGSL
jgi:peptidoglycan/xylan/chitin deacetylase (PgdA/CDA1 family)